MLGVIVSWGVFWWPSLISIGFEQKFKDFSPPSEVRVLQNNQMQKHQSHWCGCLHTFLLQIWGGSGTTAKQKHLLHPQSCAEVSKEGLFSILLQLLVKWLTSRFIVFLEQVHQWLTVLLITTEIPHKNNLSINLSAQSIFLSHKANSFYLNIDKTRRRVKRSKLNKIPH